jgi:hypothetical protein
MFSYVDPHPMKLVKACFTGAAGPVAPVVVGVEAAAGAPGNIHVWLPVLRATTSWIITTTRATIPIIGNTLMKKYFQYIAVCWAASTAS